MKKQRFELGQLVSTKAVHERMQKDLEFKYFCGKSLERHRLCDWGDLCESDKKLNNIALDTGERLMSAYVFNEETDEKIWIITERDRSVTTILFPSEY